MLMNLPGAAQDAAQVTVANAKHTIDLPSCTHAPNTQANKTLSLQSLLCIKAWYYSIFQAITTVRNGQRVSKMDGDPEAELELDGFTLILPLPYRVAIILVAGKMSGCHDT